MYVLVKVGTKCERVAVKLPTQSLIEYLLRNGSQRSYIFAFYYYYYVSSVSPSSDRIDEGQKIEMSALESLEGAG